MLEDGCCEFSNIHGLVQIRFPKGDILARAEKVRGVLLREKILNPDTQRGFASDVAPRVQAASQVSEMKYKEEVYWQVQNGLITDGPFCPRCFDGQGKKARMRETFVNGVADMGDYKHGGHVWECQVCHRPVDRNPSNGLKTGSTFDV